MLRQRQEAGESCKVAHRLANRVGGAGQTYVPLGQQREGPPVHSHVLSGHQKVQPKEQRSQRANIRLAAFPVQKRLHRGTQEQHE